MKRNPRKLTPAEMARVVKAREAAEGPDRADLIQQARKAQKQAALDDVMTVLKATRESAGISLRDLEEATGISRGNLSRLESGNSNPTVATLRRYAAAIGHVVKITVEHDPVKGRQ